MFDELNYQIKRETISGWLHEAAQHRLVKDALQGQATRVTPVVQQAGRENAAPLSAAPLSAAQRGGKMRPLRVVFSRALRIVGRKMIQGGAWLEAQGIQAR
jgi:hypothetical protein